MNRWRRRARLLIAAFGVVFAVFLARQFRHVDLFRIGAPVNRIDPRAVVETRGGTAKVYRLSGQDVSITYERQFLYADGSSKMQGVKIVADETNGKDGFEATGKEATAAKDQSTIVLNGDVQLVSSNIRARTEHATYTKGDNTVRAPGPTEVKEGRTTANGTGMTFERDRDVLSILDRAVVRIAPDANGGDATEVTSGSVTFARREKYRRFERDVRIQRGGQIMQADTAVAYLSEVESHIDTVELRGGTRITTNKTTIGGLQALTGRDVNLKYTADGMALEHAVLQGEASVQVAGEAGKTGRRIVADVMDIALAPDGSTPTALIGRGGVQLTMPAEGTVPERTIRSATLDAKGAPGRGLTRAQFAGDVQYRERGGTINRAAAAATLDVGLKPGLSTIEDARFAGAVRFEEGTMAALAAAARYDLDKGTLELSGTEPGATVPHVVNEQIVVDAAKIDVTLAGPKVKASGNVRSQLLPARKVGQKPGEAPNDVKMPSMLKQDQPVIIFATGLDYDGTTSAGTFTGAARLFQGDTTIKGETILIDDKKGDLAASGLVTSTTMLEQNTKDTKDPTKDPKDTKETKKERFRSTATARELKYDDAARRLTYTGDAHMSSPEVDMTAAKIELYLKTSGDELDRAEAYEKLTLREQNRTTTGARMTYTTADEKYVISGVPVTIVDECKRETVGRTLTFLKATDSIVVDGNSQIRTQTKGGGKCP